MAICKVLPETKGQMVMCVMRDVRRRLEPPDIKCLATDFTTLSKASFSCFKSTFDAKRNLPIVHDFVSRGDFQINNKYKI